MPRVPPRMTAVILERPNRVTVQKVPRAAKPGAQEVTCRVRAVSICGTDPRVIEGRYYGKPPHWPPSFPFIMGHEWAGEIVETGTGVGEFKVGDRVCAEDSKGCGFCSMCKRGRYVLCINYNRPEMGHRQYGLTWPGAFAEYVTVSTAVLHKLPSDVSFEEGALMQPSAIALYACRRGRVAAGDAVAVLGPGPVGLVCAQVARAMGAIPLIVSGSGPRLALAKQLGASDIVDYRREDPVHRVKELTGGRGVDVVIDATGTVTGTRQALEMVARGGRVVLVGLTEWEELTFPMDHVVLNDLEIHGIRAGPNSQAEMVRLVVDGRVNLKPLVTHRLRLRAFQKALKIFKERRGDCLKVVLKP